MINNDHSDFVYICFHLVCFTGNSDETTGYCSNMRKIRVEAIDDDALSKNYIYILDMLS